MTEREFEARFGAALRQYAERAPVDVDPLEVAVAASTAAGEQRGGRVGTAFRRAMVGAGWLAVLLLAVLVLVLAAIVGSRLIHREAPHLPPAQLGFTQAAPMEIDRPGVVAVLLRNGQVLVMGGHTPDLGGSFVVSLETAELFDESTDAFTPTGSMASPRLLFTATVLASGEVLVTGGDPTSGAVASAELFDPVSGTWRAAASMLAPRRQHTASLLADGKVLIAGGSDSSDVVGTAELYDPTSNTFAATGAMRAPRMLQGAVVLKDGHVLLAGGVGTDGPLASAELYDPKTGTFTATGPMSTARVRPMLTLLPDGKVLVTSADIPDAELYDPTTGTFRPTASEAAAHSTATSLDDGRVLVVGEAGAAGELYDEASGTFSPTQPMASADAIESATLLEDGKVLLTRGGGGTSELFDPGTARSVVAAGESSPSPGPVTAPPSAAPLPDACALVTPKEVRTILKVKSVTSALNNTDDPVVPVCAWTSGAGKEILDLWVMPYAASTWSALVASPDYAPYEFPDHFALVQGGPGGTLWVHAGDWIVHLTTPELSGSAAIAAQLRLMGAAVARVP